MKETKREIEKEKINREAKKESERESSRERGMGRQPTTLVGGRPVEDCAFETR
jgi:hypothetical protein